MRNCKRLSTTLGAFAVYFFVSGCAGTQDSPTGPATPQVSDEYLFAWQFLDVYFIFRDRLPSEPYSFNSPQELYRSVNEPYTRYYPPDSIEELTSTLSTSVNGVGIVADSVGPGYAITDIFNDSPAQKEGLMIGDTILSVDGTSLQNVSYEQLSNMLRGEVGEQKLLRIKRNEQVMTLTVVLEEFYSPTVFVDSIDETTAYIQITAFLNETNVEGGTASEFDQALAETDWAQNTILDLRDNPGGELDQCIRVTSEFLPPSTPIVRVTQRVLVDPNEAQGDTKDTLWQSVAVGGDALQRQFYLLQNNVTASASEILIVSLNQYRPEIRTIGTTTFGKARGQVVGLSPDSGMVRVSYATISPVEGPEYDIVGIEPQIAVTEAQSALDVALQLTDRGAARLGRVSTRFNARFRLIRKLYGGRNEEGLLVRFIR